MSKSKAVVIVAVWLAAALGPALIAFATKNAEAAEFVGFFAFGCAFLATLVLAVEGRSSRAYPRLERPYAYWRCGPAHNENSDKGTKKDGK